MSLYTASLQGQTKVKRAGQCCDECAAAKGSCLYEGTVRYHGDMWNGTGCEFCSCNRGQVLCQRAECGRVECPQVSLKEIIFFIRNQEANLALCLETLEKFADCSNSLFP